MLVIPFILGNLESLLYRSGEFTGIAGRISFGYALELAVFCLLSVPLIFFRAPYAVLKWSFIACIAVLCAMSVPLSVKTVKSLFSREGSGALWRGDRENRLTLTVMAAAIFIIVFQTALVVFTMHMDADDARFVGEALEVAQQGTMLSVNPLTGEVTGGYDGIPKGVPVGEMRKDAASPYPVFLGMLSDLTALNPAVLSHTVLPVFLIPLSYAVFYLTGITLFNRDRQKTWIFLLLLSVIMLFSFESEFAPGYTLLNIIWQGRSIAEAVFLPLLFYAFLRIRPENGIKAQDILLLLIINLDCCLLSGTAAIVAAVMTLAYSFVKACAMRSPASLVIMGCTILPDLFCLVYGQYILKAMYRL